MNNRAKVPVEVSARHLHLSREDQDVLFGKGYEMRILKDLSQTGQWAGEEKVIIRGPKGELQVRVLGPCRSRTQVELSRTDCYSIGISAEHRLSGRLDGSPGCTLIGPNGEVTIKEGVIVPLRHLHISDKEAEERGLHNGDVRAVRVAGARGVTFHDVHVRVNENFRLAMHLDTDEGNAVWADQQGTEGEIVDL